MNLKSVFTLLFLVTLSLQLKSQIFNNIYEDAIALREFCTTTSSGKVQLDGKEFLGWKKILKKYVPLNAGDSYETFLSSFDNNPFQLSKDQLLPLILPQKYIDSLQKVYLQEVVVIGSNTTYIPLQGRISGAGSPGTAQITDALVQLVIKRGKEELTATFFEQFKKQLKQNPELKSAFPKTAEFIDQIESYLYASYLITLREGFHEDINNLPFNLGAVLRSERMKNYMFKKPKNGNVWLAIPILCFLGDLRQNKSLGEAIKELNPDEELGAVNKNYYNILKLTVLLSESIRDKTGKENWIKPETFKTQILDDEVTRNIFFGLLYQSARDYSNLSAYITTANVSKIQRLLTEFNSLLNNTRTAASLINKQTAVDGKDIEVAQLLSLINNSADELQPVFETLNDLSPSNTSVNTKLFFETVPRITTIVANFNQKRYALGVMNSMLLINQYISKDEATFTPFKSQPFLNPAMTDNPDEFFDTAIKRLKQYALDHPDDHIDNFIETMDNIAKDKDSERQDRNLENLLKRMAKHQYKSDGSNIYQKLLKYGSMMASMSEAQTTEDISSALEAAILPVGSSSLKYYTTFSFSINSYIGASYYNEYYNFRELGKRYTLKTAGVALPIGINFSKSTRWSKIGAVSVFVSLLDLGALASYRLSNPPNVTSEDLPEFKLQNIIAPGGYLILGRLFKTPLAIGLGIQKGPQLRKIMLGEADISTYKNWRLGAFLSVDIPFFNLYSKSLRKPLE